MRLGAVLAFAALLTSAQPNPVIRTETQVVLVDAIVTAKNGTYVNDLTAKDFRVWQDNREQTIQSFALEKASASAQPRSLVLFFDETSMEIRDQIQVRQDASRFIDAETGPNRRLAVVVYKGAMRVVQSFTDNAGRLKDALPVPESNSSQSENPTRPGQTNAPVNSAAGDLGARNILHALQSLADNLGALPGRKIVVLFSGRIPTSSAQRFEAQEVMEACNRSGVAIYPVDVRPVSVQLDTDPSPTMLPADRSQLQIPRGRSRQAQPHGDGADDLGAPQDSGAASQQMLFGLANGTGGFVIRNTNDLLAELQRIAAEQDEYYALTYTPPESKDGACHTLRVKVDRGGTTVRARKSYCTTKPQDLLSGTTAGSELEKHAAESQAGNIRASITLPYFYVSANRAEVHVAMEIAPDAVKFENQKGRLHAQINLLGIAATADGEVRARFSDVVNLNFENQAQADSLKGRLIHYEKQFQIVPGEYKFTMAFGQGSASFGKVEAPLTVDAWGGEELALSSIVLSRETHPATDIGLGLVAEERRSLIAEGLEVVPSGSNQFMRSEPGLFYFEVYGREASSVRVRVRLVDRASREGKWNSGEMKLPAASGANGSTIVAGAQLPLGLLAAGSYELEITASGSGGKQVKRTAELEVR